MASINRGDNTGAFGNDFLRIYLNNPNNLAIQKAVFQINGDLEKEFYDPIFPLRINFTGEETNMLHQFNTCKLALWDEFGRRRTADGKFTFLVKENRIKEPDNPICEDYQEYPEDNSVHFNLDDAEFACQFVINATPTKMSELEQDIHLMKLENILPGRNIQTFIEGEYMTINAELETPYSYNELEDKPTVNGIVLEGDIEIEAEQVNADWKATEGKAQILNKPHFQSVAYSGNYHDLVGTPDIPTKLSELQNDAGYIGDEKLADYYNKEEVDALIQHEVDLKPVYDEIHRVDEERQADFIELNSKIDTKATSSELTEAVEVLSDKDARQDANISRVKSSVEALTDVVEKKANQSDLEEVEEQLDKFATHDELTDAILPMVSIDEFNARLNQKANKDSIYNGKLSIIANGSVKGEFTANSRDNVTVRLDIPNKTSDLINDSGFITSEIVGSYVTQEELSEQLEGKANIDEVGKGILTIQQNDEIKGTFNANAKASKTIKLETPTKLSELTQDIDYLTEEDIQPIESKLATLEQGIESNTDSIITLQDKVDKKLDYKTGYSLVQNTEIKRLAKVDNYDDTELRAEITELSDKVDGFDMDISNKVDKIEGKGLSTEDYTREDKYTLGQTAESLATTVNRVNDISTQTIGLASQVESQGEETRVVKNLVNNEITLRQEADIELQKQIEALQAKSTVKDIVGTIDELDTYDRSKLIKGDVICVIRDKTRDNTVSYYRYNGETFNYIGSEGTGYSRSEADNKFAPKSLKINGFALDKDIELRAKDVDALPDTTVIGNGRLTIQRNREQLGVFDANQVANETINIEVPTDTNHLTNGAEFVSKSVLLKYYLGENIPADTLIQDEITYLDEKVNRNTAAIAVLQGNLPEVALTGSYNDLLDKPFIPTKTSDITNNSGYVVSSQKKTLEAILEEYAHDNDIPKYVSQLENDRGYVTATAVGKGNLTFYLADDVIGQFNANTNEDITINIPVESTLKASANPISSTAVQTAITGLDSKAVHLTGNETVNGTKTFTSIIVPTQNKTDNSTKAASTAYVKAQDYCTNTDAVHKAGAETITGNKTFSGTVSLGTATATTVATKDNSTNIATTAWVNNQAYAVDNKAVHKEGNEEINGNKTFNETTTFVGITNLGEYAHVSTADGTVLDAPVNVEYLNTNNYSKSEIDTTLSAYSTTAQINTTLGGYYTKTQVDNTLKSYYTKTQIDNTIGGYYTKGQMDTKFAGYYTQSEVDNLLKAKQDQITALQTALEALTRRVEALEG